MKETFINDVVQGMIPFLDNAQLEELRAGGTARSD